MSSDGGSERKPLSFPPNENQPEAQNLLKTVGIGARFHSTNNSLPSSAAITGVTVSYSYM